MKAVLGIDAAWTDKNPSGVALIVEEDGRWHCVAVAPSYAAFLAIADGRACDWAMRHRGEPPNPLELIASCRKLTGAAPAVVAVDMPLATVPITGYRTADRATSQRFSHHGCSVLPPSASMPGPTGVRIGHGFRDLGFSLATAFHAAATHPALIEVYPHAAIVRLMKLAKRHTYKESRARRYWPTLSSTERRLSLLACLNQLATALASEIADIPLPHLDHATTLKRHGLKAYEDTLDALVCAWVGAQYLMGRAEAFGDDTAAIWVPLK